MYNPIVCIVCDREDIPLNRLYSIPPVCNCSFSSSVHIDCISLLSEVSFRCYTCKMGLPDIYKDGLKYEKYESKEGFIIERIYDRNDVLWGDYKVWWIEGKIRELSFFLKGRREGLLRKFHAQGTNSEECLFKRGKRNGLHMRWYPSGNIWSETIYSDDLENGEYEEWYSDGKAKKVKCKYANGNLYGEFIEYYENGIIAKRCMYVNGIVRGRIKYYTEDGLDIVEKENEKDVSESSKKEGLIFIFKDMFGGIFNTKSGF